MLPDHERQLKIISRDYHKCFAQKCKLEQKQVAILHNEHKTFIKILNKLVEKGTITRDEFFHLLKANADRISDDPIQTSLSDCKLKQCYDLFYRYTMMDMQATLQKDISPNLRKTIEKYHKKFSKNKITTDDLRAYSEDLYNNI
jgi:hypothetical protein